MNRPKFKGRLCLLLLVMLDFQRTFCIERRSDEEASQFQTLNWSPYVQPQITEILTTPTANLELIQSDSLVVRKVSTQRKLDLKEVTVFVDKTDLGLRAHNIKRSLRLLSENEIQFHSQFQSCSRCFNEYISKELLTYEECTRNCAAHRSMVFNNMELLTEIKKTFRSGLNQIWVKTNQEASSDGYYAAHYNLTVGEYRILPQNNYSEGNRTRCYMAEKSTFSVVKCNSLPAKVRYFQQTNDSYDFYHQNFFRLNVLVNLDTSYDLSYALGQTNLTFEKFQKKNAVFEVYLATPQDVLQPTNSRHRCMCWRQRTLSPTKDILKSRIDTLVHEAGQIGLDVERERVKSHGHLSQSNSRHILSRAADIYARKPLDKYLSMEEILPLQVNASLSVFTETKKMKVFPSILSRIGQNLHLSGMLADGRAMEQEQGHGRKKRGLPLTALLGLIKITGPYLLEQSPAVMEFLKTKLNGRLWKSSSAVTLTENMTSYLSRDLGRNAIIEPKFDRLFFKFKSNHTYRISTEDMMSLDDHIIDRLENAVDQLKFYEEEIEKKLVPHIFQLLLPRIKNQLRKGGQVLSSVSSSKSFSRIKFIFETIMPAAVTHVSLSSLPHRKEGAVFYNLAVSNSSFDLYSTENLPDSFSSYDCQNRLFGDQTAPLREICTEKRYAEQEVEIIMEMNSLKLMLFRGPAQLNYQCKVHPRGHFDLVMTFNLLIVHKSCHLKGRLRNGKDYNKNPEIDSGEDRFEKVQAVLLLNYNLSEMSPFSQKVTIWLAVIGTGLILVTMCIVLIILYVVIWKGKWSRRIQNAVMDIEPSENTEVYFRRSVSPQPMRRSRSVSSTFCTPLNQLPKDIRVAEQEMERAFTREQMERANEQMERALQRDQINKMDEETLKDIFPHLNTENGGLAPTTSLERPMSSGLYPQIKPYSTIKRAPQTAVVKV